LYNYGTGDTAAGDPAYVEQVVVTSPDGARRYEVAGFTTAIAWCDSGMYSVAEAGEPLLDIARQHGAQQYDIPPTWSDILSRVYPPGDPLVGQFRSVLPDGRQGYAQWAICRDETILTVTSGQAEATRLVIWPTDGTPPSAVPLVGLAGEPLNLDPYIASQSRIMDWAPDKRELVWFGGDGKLRSSNLDTGQTSTLWDSEIDWNRSANNTVTFQGSTLYLFTVQGEPSANPTMRFWAHNLDSEQTTDILTVNLHAKSVDRALEQRGFAIRPTHDT
jgi:hypothetical protein